MKHAAKMICCVVALVSIGGCASLVKGVDAGGGAVYARGTLRALVGAPQPEIQTATAKAMEELDFVAVDSEADKLKATVTARMADGTKVTVKLEAEDFDSTHVMIKVGSFGNQSISSQILKHIQRQLSH